MSAIWGLFQLAERTRVFCGKFTGDCDCTQPTRHYRIGILVSAIWGLFQLVGKIWKVSGEYFDRCLRRLSRRQQSMRIYHIKNRITCERDLGSLPAGWENLQAAGRVFC